MIRKTKYRYANVVKKRKQAKGHGYANLFRPIQDKHENYEEEMLADWLWSLVDLEYFEYGRVVIQQGQVACDFRKHDISVFFYKPYWNAKLIHDICL